MADPSETTQAGEPIGGGSTAIESAEVLRAIRDLSTKVGSLQGELHALRAQTNALPPGSEPGGWDDARDGGPDMLTWVRALDTPGPREPAVPRLLLEIVFLVSVAVAAAIAELDTAAIVGVMAGAWVLVAVAEYAAARAARRRAEAVYAPFAGLVHGYPTDPSWFAPPVERTVIDVVETGTETQAKLPPPSED